MTEETQMTVKIPTDLEQRSRDLTKMADSMTVTDHSTWLKAKEFITGLCRPLVKEIEDCFDDPISNANKLHKGLCAKKKKYLQDPEEAEKIAQRKMKNWEIEEDRRKEEEARRIREEQERLAEIDRKKKAEEEKQRQEAQLIAQEALRKAEEEKRLQEAIKLEKEGKMIESTAVLDKPIVTPQVSIPQPEPEMPPPPPPTVQEEKPKDVISTKKWTYAIFDDMKINRLYLMPNTTEIGKLVRALGPKAQEIVGGIIVSEDRTYTFKETK
jgi:hypothetical protein